MKKHILIFLSISIIFTACDARARNGVSDTTNATPTLRPFQVLCKLKKLT